jgi:hypothetical protein
MVIDANDKTVLHCPEEYTALDRANLELIVVSVNGSWVRAMNAVGYGTNGADEEGGA